MSDLPRTRQSLLLKLGRREDGAWAEFLEVYEGAILAACRARGLQEADARDVTQEVLAAVYRQIDGWDADRERGSFRGWLLQVARRRSIDALRARSRRAAVEGDEADRDRLAQLPDGADPDRAALELELRRATFAFAARRVRAEVQPKTWDAFERTAVQGLPASRVAADLGVSVAAVYTAKCRVLARIRARIDEVRSDDGLDLLPPDEDFPPEPSRP